jgi:holin-like protein
MIPGLVKLFLFQAIGELISNFLIPFIPGPVIGLVLLLAFLVIRNSLPSDIDTVGSTILQHLGLLFIPASVGVILYLPILKANAWAVLGTLVVSVIATIAVTGGLLKLIAGERDES